MLGGFILGVGITLTGSCPVSSSNSALLPSLTHWLPLPFSSLSQGTVFAQLGAGLSSAPWIVLGAVVGVVVFRSASLGLRNTIVSPRDCVDPAYAVTSTAA